MPRRIESLFVAGPAGRLEALLEEPEEAAPAEACVLCHPHPLYGGTMHNKVVYRLARGLRRSGSVVLRFNFRGVNLSEGTHDDGAGEIEDARSALNALRERYPDLPFALAGFSFGSRVILRLGCSLTDPAPVRLIAAGFPTRLGALDHLDGCAIPKYIVQSTHDEFGPADALRNAFESFAEPKQLQFIEASDHFFAGSLEKLEDAVAALPRP
ncbi:MAG TPA: alpha/beta fold hydrolase [Bryobacteraceae bacterium]|nr:alpha/beta fold hydrolase [Bryobacteraceae bacterium]